MYAAPNFLEERQDKTVLDHISRHSSVAEEQ